jgi:hypothetical protein
VRFKQLIVAIVLTVVLLKAGLTQAETLQVNWLTQYGNESIQTANLATQPRMLTNISNSLMTAAPSFLDGSTYLQRRSDFVNNYQQYYGIGETSQEWLRENRVTISQPAVVIAAVREDYYPGAGALLDSLGWTSLGQTITLNYYIGAAQLSLYAGLVDAGPVWISGAGVDQLRISGVDVNSSSDYFFFQNESAFPPASLADLKVVSVPETSAIVLASLGAIGLMALGRRVHSPTFVP